MAFDSAISEVPQLRAICSSALSTDGIPGSGLKLLRLVSRNLRKAMLGVIQSYTLQLDGRATRLLNQMNLLESTRLSHLQVVVTDDYHGEQHLGVGELVSGISLRSLLYSSPQAKQHHLVKVYSMLKQ